MLNIPPWVFLIMPSFIDDETAGKDESLVESLI